MGALISDISMHVALVESDMNNSPLFQVGINALLQFILFLFLFLSFLCNSAEFSFLVFILFVF